MPISSSKRPPFIPGRTERKRLSVYDTIEVPLPSAAGRKFDFFADISQKEALLTNVVDPRRLPQGWCMDIDRVYLRAASWSGDNFQEFLRALATFRFTIGLERLVVEGPVRELLDMPWIDVDYKGLTDKDDLRAVVKFEPSQFTPPTVFELVEKHVEREEAINLPPKWHAFARRFGLQLPTITHRWTEWHQVERQRKGSVLLHLRFEGPGEVPLGA